ncbi:RagB/SusD family nutrient uptake outer membrane protein [Tenacibaculum sp.]|uniref:RagB/SusD family nutrient uptake outer membrane protein n=1 Tax=Tenacibaculum sp. TaxID=1906242 RepID=UPI003D100348
MLRKINIIIATVSLLAITSCSEDFLETKPTDAISASDAYSSPENMNLVLNGLHRNMYGNGDILPGGSFQRTGESHFIPSFDAIGGNIIHSSPGNGWMTADLKWLMHTVATSTTVTQQWYQRYNFIAVSNNLINAVNKNFNSADPKIAKILGQAYAYRAWAYWRLVTTYAKGYLVGNPSTDLGVPIILQTGAPYTSAPRSTVSEVYAQIESDINNAILYLGNGDTSINKSEISVNAAQGIKARIALSKGDWNAAATAAAAARQGYPLLTEGDWLSGFNSVGLSEVIWGGAMIDAETNFFASYFYYVSPTFNGSQNRTNPKLISKELYDAIPTTDFRNKAWLPTAPNTYSSASNGLGGDWEADPNYATEEEWLAAKAAIIQKYGMTSGHNTHPYMNVKFLQKNPGTIDVDDVIYMRSSEMYLIEAEAKAMMNDIAGAQSVLQEFGGARDTAYDSSVFNTQTALMDHIKWQRGVELWGEGFSYHDHIRWDEGLDQTNSGASLVLYRDGFTQAKPSTNDAWIWKIPQAEIDANPNISEADQN